MSYVNVKNANAASNNITDNGGTNGGGNNSGSPTYNWLFVTNVIVSGVMYQSNGTTPDTSQTVAYRINNGSATTTTTNASTGAYTFSIPSLSAGQTITIYSTTAGANAVAVTDGVSNFTVNLTVNQVQVVNGGQAVTIAALSQWSATNDGVNMEYTAATGSPNTLSVASGYQLNIVSGATFTPGGNTTVLSGGVNVGLHKVVRELA